MEAARAASETPLIDTVAVADALAVPPDPVQARANVVKLVNAPVDWLPEVALVPDHAPEAEQDVAFVEDQVSIELPPLVTEVGFAANDTAGRFAACRTSATSTSASPQPHRPRVASRVEKNMTAKILDPSFLALDIREDLEN